MGHGAQNCVTMWMVATELTWPCLVLDRGERGATEWGNIFLANSSLV